MIITDDNFNNLITEAKKKKVPDLKVVKGTPKAKKLSSFKFLLPVCILLLHLFIPGLLCEESLFLLISILFT